MASRECPRCRLTSPANAVRCDCGWDFAANAVERTYLKHDEYAALDQGSFPLGLGLGLLASCFGLVVAHLINRPKTIHGAWVGFGISVGLSLAYSALVTAFAP